MLLALQILIVLGAIVLGARLGSIAIGFAGGLGVLLLSLTGVPVTAEDIPFDVIGIIMCVITAIAAFPAVSALFVLPTYPTLLAAVEMDDTGSTRIGRFVFDHPFMVPGVVNIALSVLLAYGLGAILL